MMEETNEKTKDLVVEVCGALEIPAVHDTLADFYELMNDPAVKRKGFDDEAERGLFRTYHILVHLSDYPGVKSKALGQQLLLVSFHVHSCVSYKEGPVCASLPPLQTA